MGYLWVKSIFLEHEIAERNSSLQLISMKTIFFTRSVLKFKRTETIRKSLSELSSLAIQFQDINIFFIRLLCEFS